MSFSAFEDGHFEKAKPSVVLFYSDSTLEETTDIDMMAMSLQDPLGAGQDSGIIMDNADQVHAIYFNTFHPWTQQVASLEKPPAKRVVPISVCHTPRYLGQTNSQVLFHSGEQDDYVTKHVISDSWEGLIEAVLAYLNKYIRPHSLLSLSFFMQSHGSWMFEDDVEAAKQWIVPIHAVICHRSDSNGYRDIWNDDNASHKMSEEAPLYKHKVIKVKNWQKDLALVADMCNDPHSRYKVCCATQYPNEGLILVVEWPEYLQEFFK